jgi:hypothetical protein
MGYESKKTEHYGPKPGNGAYWGYKWEAKNFQLWKARVGAALTMVVTGVLPGWCAHPCVQCHPKEVTGYSVTQMAHSAGPPTRVASGRFTHALSDTRFSIESSDSGMVQRLERNGASGEYKIAYEIGSGTHAFAYLIDLQDHLFQSPIGYFSGRGWDMSPGYENSKAPDFDRPVTPDCLVCHSGRALPVPGTWNTYQNPPFEAEAIGCERCHGPLAAHLSSPVRGSIVNPANLSPRARDSVCEQCHLIGEERVPNPGKRLSDFRPGQNLEDVYTVYVSVASRDPSRPNPLKVVSQVQQLALSTCKRRSQGKLWCGTCHDPHLQPADPKTYFRDRCLSCHGVALLKSHPKPSDDCIHCHMPLRPVTDGAHTVFTDHRISRRPLPQSGTAGTEEPPTLVAWHDPPAALAERNLGLAYVKVGDRRESPALVSQGFQLLYACCSDLPDDPQVLAGIGNALLAAGQASFAAGVFERAIQIEPNNALNYLHAGLAGKALHDKEKTVDNLEKAVQLDPLLEQPYLELAKFYAESHDTVMLQRTNERHLKAFPKSIRAQLLFLNGQKYEPKPTTQP